LNLGRAELDLVRAIERGDPVTASEVSEREGWTINGVANDKSRERGEVEQKLQKLGVRIPWLTVDESLSR
jgi:hypothetical protein